MKRFARTAVSVLMLICLLGVSSCSKFMLGREETVVMPDEETGTVTIPEKGCPIEFPKRKPYEYDM